MGLEVLELAVYGVVIVLFGYIIRNMAMSSSRYQRLQHVVMLIEACYGAGVLMKFTEVGPAFIRYHLSDVGFPAMVSRALFWALMFAYRNVYARKHASRVPESGVAGMAATVLPRQASVVLAVLVSCAYEVFVGWLYDRSGLEVKLVGDFDWIDIAAYAIGGAALLVSYREMSKIAVQALEQYRAQLEAEQLARQRRRAQLKSDRKKTKSSRKTRPGGRR